MIAAAATLVEILIRSDTVLPISIVLVVRIVTIGEA